VKLFLRVMSLLALAIAPPTARASNCAGTSTGMIPVNDLGPGFYKGVQGGLYPGGSNLRPATHEAAGVAIANSMTPLDTLGQPDAVNGHVVFVSIGMSNCTQEFSAFDQHYVRFPSAFLRCLRNSLVVLGVMPNGLMDHFPLALRFSSCTLIDGALMVAGFGQQLLVAGPARRFEFAGFERRRYRTSRLARVRAIVETALSRERGDTRKHIVDGVLSRPKSQFAQARCVDQRTTIRQFH